MPAQNQPAQNQDAEILHRMERAFTTTVRLMGRGITVLGVAVAGGEPVIDVQDSEQSRALPGVVAIRGGDGLNRRTIHTTQFDGCQVRWGAI